MLLELNGNPFINDLPSSLNFKGYARDNFLKFIEYSRELRVSSLRLRFVALTLQTARDVVNSLDSFALEQIMRETNEQ